MKTNKEQAIIIGKKAMQDIDFSYDKSAEVTANYDDGKILYQGINVWLIGFDYGSEDYGENVFAGVVILDDEGKATNVNYRNGFIKLGYDEEQDKYFIAEKR